MNTVGHVKSIQFENQAWCGEELTSEFHFKGVEQAVLNGIHYTNIASCPACIAKIVQTLQDSCKFVPRGTPEGSKETIA